MWDDDRLLHEGCWAVESFVSAMRQDGVIPAGVCQYYTRIEDWTKLVRKVWHDRNEAERKARQMTCEHVWEWSVNSIPPYELWKKCQSSRPASTS